MTDIRTLDDLQQRMQEEFAWRKKELHGLKSNVELSRKTRFRDASIRAGIAMLYAHWEGLIKQVGQCYLEFVRNRRLTHQELARHFLALSISKIVRNAAQTSKLAPWIEIVDLFQSKMEDRCRPLWSGAINTKSNLNSEIFREISMVLGIDYSRFQTKEKLIDEKLLANRNRIAHGQYLDVEYDEYLEIHGEMVGIMQDFYDQIEELAFSEAYRAT